ncbi:hypothetical protein ACFXKC_41490 [Streptomyces sp. NPDC059340]|uniref:hypothetical protein n=1 Tax=Streptomyces sp. NPDC059340 TaxID=3346806 RepID=UPI0036B92824
MKGTKQPRAFSGQLDTQQFGFCSMPFGLWPALLGSPQANSLAQFTIGGWCVVDPVTLAAATALVGAMATDGWQQARDATVALWRRVRPERAEAIAGDLELTRPRVLTARQRGEDDREQALVTSWRLHVQDLLDQDAGLASDVRRLVDECLLPLLPPTEQTSVRAVVQHVDTRDHSQSIVAGRDAHVTQTRRP